MCHWAWTESAVRFLQLRVIRSSKSCRGCPKGMPWATALLKGMRVKSGFWVTELAGNGWRCWDHCEYNGLQKTTSKRGVTVCSCSFLASTKEKKKHLDYSTLSHSTFHLFSISKYNLTFFFLGVHIEVKFKIRMKIKAHCYNCSWE